MLDCSPLSKKTCVRQVVLEHLDDHRVAHRGGRPRRPLQLLRRLLVLRMIITMIIIIIIIMIGELRPISLLGLIIPAKIC